MKIGLIRCQQTENLCAGTADFAAIKNGTGAFEKLGSVEIIGFVSCGGCPGKNAVRRAKLLAARGAEAIVFCSCISKGTPIDFPCPHFEAMRKAVSDKLGSGTKIIDYSH